MSFAGFVSPMACEQNVYEASATWPTSWAKSTNFRCWLEGVVFFRHFLRRTDDRATYKRVKTFFARGNRVRGRSGLHRRIGRRRWFLLPEQSKGNSHQCNQHKNESLGHENSFRKNRVTLRVVKKLRSERPQSTIRMDWRVVSR